MDPRGATELQMEMLHKHVSKELLDQVQICTSIPGKVPIDPNKINMLWQKNSWDQNNLQPFFRDKSRHNEYDWYVFNSHWNYEKFRMVFDIPTEKSVVIKNGIEDFPIRKIYKRGTPIKLVHHCTPWRGLNVLLRAMQDVENPNITLDVYSSCKVYGSEFADNTEKDFEALYEQARKLPNVNYIGYIGSRKKLRKIFSNSDLFIFPSYYESFGKLIIESLSCGIPVIANNAFGAKDIISHKNDGFLVKNQNLNDYIKGIEFFKNSNKKIIEKNCLHKSQKYTIDLIGKKYTEIYEKL